MNIRGKYILLVEDDSVTAIQEKLILTKQGLNVKAVPSGEEAVCCVEKEQFDLILMDIDLGAGKMDGTEAAAAILRKKDVPILFLSNHTEIDVVEKTENISSYGYVVKNSGDTVLIAAIKMALRLHSAHLDLAQHRDTLAERDHYREVLFNVVHEGFLRTDSSGIIISANQAAAEMTGYSSPEKIIGRSIEEGYQEPALREKIRSQIFREKIVRNMEFALRRKNGTTLWTLCNIRALFDDDGIFTGTEALFRDYSKQKALQENLIQHVNELHRVIKMISYPLEICGPDGTVILANQAFLDMSGIPSEDLIVGKYNIFKDEIALDVFGLRDAVEQAYAGEKVFLPEVEIRFSAYEFAETVSDDSRWFEISMIPVVDETGTVTQVLSIWIDISERKRNEVFYVDSLRQLKEVHALAHIGVWSWNITSDRVYWSEELFRIAGLNPGNDAPCFAQQASIYTKESWDILTASVKKAVETGESYEAELNLVRPDGSVRTVYAFGCASRSAGGQITELHGTLQDITDRKRAEEALSISEDRYRRIFDTVSVSLWEEDVSAIRKQVKGLRQNGVADTAGFLREHPEMLISMIKSIKVLDVNKATLDMFEAGSIEDFQEALDKTFSEKTMPLFVESVLALAREDTFLEGETEMRTMDGRQLNLLIRMTIPKEHANPNTVLVAMTDISDIKKSEKEKDYLLKEITHRVKNNLAMVSSLVRIKGSTLGPEADLTDLVNQIDAVRIVHEKLNKRDGISDIDIHDYFEEILSTVFSFKAGISYQNSVTRINVSPRTAVPLGLILNEAATNTVKYAFPEKNKGIFSVKLNQDKAEAVYILTLGNDGCPIPESIDIENPETMGFRLIYALTSQLEGTMEVIRSPRPLMIFRFPAEVFEQTSL